MTVSEYTIALISAVLHDEIPPEKPDELSFDELLTFVHRHKLENICFAAVERLNGQPDETRKRKWSRSRDINLAQALAQEQEKRVLAEAFRASEIPFLPMKDWHLRGMYPQMDFRFMSDIDILIRREDRDRSCELMQRLGYSRDRDDNGSNDSYQKAPYLHVELHLDMVSPGFEAWHQYYRNIWDRAYPTEVCEYALNRSDYYIYMMVNFAKDYQTKGTGIRSALDLYVFLEKCGDELDDGYVKRELERLGLRELSDAAVELARGWFGRNAEGTLRTGLAAKLERDGIYGSRRQRIQNSYLRLTKDRRTRTGKRISFLLQRAFPGLKRMRYRYPALEKVPVLLPVFWVVRWCRHSDDIRQELDAVKKLGK